MTRRALFAIFLFCCLSLPVQGFSDFGLPQACNRPLSDAYSAHYTGTIGTAAIFAKLTFSGDSVTGVMIEPRTGIMTDLAGSLTNDGHLTLAVSQIDWPNFGGLDLTCNGDDNDTLAGEAWGIGSQRGNPCVFTRSATYGTFTSNEGPLITDSTGARQPAVIASIEYPRFLAPAFAPLNQALAGRARRDWNNIQTASSRALADTTTGTGPRRDLRVRRTFIYYADDALVGMLTLEYSETGNPPRSGRAWLTENYQFTDRQPRHINLHDLFRDGTPWVARLSSFCRAELSRQGGADVPPLLTANDLQAFLLSPVGVSFWFDPGLVTDESQGDFRVIVPWSEIADLIDRNGPAARFLSTY